MSCRKSKSRSCPGETGRIPDTPGAKRAEREQIIRALWDRHAPMDEILLAEAVGNLVLVEMRDKSKLVVPSAGWRRRFPIRDWYSVNPERRAEASAPPPGGPR
jgi:hypothetical protein